MSRFNLYDFPELMKMAKRDDLYDALTAQNRVETEYFGSVHELMSTLEKRDVSDYDSDSRKHAVLCPGNMRTKYDDWHGFTSAEDLRHQLETGSPGFETGRIDARLKQVMCETEHVRGKVRYGPVGGSVCVPRALIGIPAMRHRDRDASAQGRVINLVVDNVVPASRSPSQISAAGTCIMEAVALLQREGYRIGLNIMNSANDWKDHRFRAMAVNIKRPGNPLDLAIVNWWLTSPAVLRGVAFSWFASSPDTHRARCLETIGSVPDIPTRYGLAAILCPGCVCIPLSTLVDMREKSGHDRRDWVIQHVTEA